MVLLTPFSADVTLERKKIGFNYVEFEVPVGRCSRFFTQVVEQFESLGFREFI